MCTPLTSSAYFAALLEMFEDLAAAQGYEIMQVLSHGDPALELRRVQALVGRNVDGLILIPTHDPRATLDLVAERATPTVIVDRVTGDRRFDYVTIDDRKAMREATRHVLALGHRAPLYIVRDARLPTTQRRIEGFRASRARGATEARRRRCCSAIASEQVFARQVADALAARSPPTAIIASNSAIALSLVRVLQDLRVRWPDDVSLARVRRAGVGADPLAAARGGAPSDRSASRTRRGSGCSLRVRDAGRASRGASRCRRTSFLRRSLAPPAAPRAMTLPLSAAPGAILLWSTLAALGLALAHLPPFLLTGCALVARRAARRVALARVARAAAPRCCSASRASSASTSCCSSRCASRRRSRRTSSTTCGRS